MIVIPELGRQEGYHKFEASLDYITSEIPFQTKIKQIDKTLFL